ncbi:ArdC-like ssDNA-binding domain-containing protein [uncultured Ruegeria sp.]|uniref:ArdC family protein n=1 Tax=uncultured Ruegeria sp. TaxID=259304 RepID=UPI00260A022A|nr:ArdC-like ssDNA-binding domain-containing protein [uncultured Ruegeria sp.]
MGKPKFNIYEHVTETIFTEMQAGTVPWRQPWSGGSGFALPLRSTGEQYRGINVLMLLIAAMKRGYDCRSWMTYRQAQELGGQVRKGEKSTTVVKFGTITKEGETDPVTGAEGEEHARRYARAYRVFNTCQIDGLDEHWYDRPAAQKEFGTQSDPALDAWFASLGVPIEHSADPRAYYHIVRDVIHMPRVQTFESAAGLYDTLAHEEAHAVAVEKRLGLTFEGKTAALKLATEECFAELTGAMVCARLGVPASARQNAAYIKHWLEILGESNGAVFRVASMAQAAADWMFAKAGDPDCDIPAVADE